MAGSLVQFRADDAMKLQAIGICDRLGIDLSTYLRMCMSRLVQENGIPFSMKLEDIPEPKGVAAMRAASEIAGRYGIADMPLEEINAEIEAARKTEQ